VLQCVCCVPTCALVAAWHALIRGTPDAVAAGAGAVPCLMLWQRVPHPITRYDNPVCAVPSCAVSVHGLGLLLWQLCVVSRGGWGFCCWLLLWLVCVGGCSSSAAGQACGGVRAPVRSISPPAAAGSVSLQVYCRALQRRVYSQHHLLLQRWTCCCCSRCTAGLCRGECTCTVRLVRGKACIRCVDVNQAGGGGRRCLCCCAMLLQGAAGGLASPCCWCNRYIGVIPCDAHLVIMLPAWADLPVVCHLWLCVCCAEIPASSGHCCLCIPWYAAHLQHEGCQVQQGFWCTVHVRGCKGVGAVHNRMSTGRAAASYAGVHMVHC
jgi:hypothetical protein